MQRTHRETRQDGNQERQGAGGDQPMPIECEACGNKRCKADQDDGPSPRREHRGTRRFIGRWSCRYGKCHISPPALSALRQGFNVNSKVPYEQLQLHEHVNRSPPMLTGGRSFIFRPGLKDEALFERGSLLCGFSRRLSWGVVGTAWPIGPGPNFIGPIALVGHCLTCHRLSQRRCEDQN